jgi:hypothetical protein
MASRDKRDFHRLENPLLETHSQQHRYRAFCRVSANRVELSSPSLISSNAASIRSTSITSHSLANAPERAKHPVAGRLQKISKIALALWSRGQCLPSDRWRSGSILSAVFLACAVCKTSRPLKHVAARRAQTTLSTDGSSGYLAKAEKPVSMTPQGGAGGRRTWHPHP